MPEATMTKPQDWRCHLGRHHYAPTLDDNPEVRAQLVLVCTRCGKHEDGPYQGGVTGMGIAGMGGGLGPA